MEPEKLLTVQWYCLSLVTRQDGWKERVTIVIRIMPAEPQHPNDAKSCGGPEAPRVPDTGWQWSTAHQLEKANSPAKAEDPLPLTWVIL